MINNLGKYKLDFGLINATADDFEFVKRAKLSNIFEYAKGVSDEEYIKILNYVDRYLAKFLYDYLIIIKDKNKCGCYLLKDYEDGVLLDEIYLLTEYRCQGIGTRVLKNILKLEKKIYLCVYKDNVRAIDLYDKLGFKILDEKDGRYWMCYNNQ